MKLLHLVGTFNASSMPAYTIASGQVKPARRLPQMATWMFLHGRSITGVILTITHLNMLLAVVTCVSSDGCMRKDVNGVPEPVQAQQSLATSSH